MTTHLVVTGGRFGVVVCDDGVVLCGLCGVMRVVWCYEGCVDCVVSWCYEGCVDCVVLSK